MRRRSWRRYMYIRLDDLQTNIFRTERDKLMNPTHVLALLPVSRCGRELDVLLRHRIVKVQANESQTASGDERCLLLGSIMHQHTKRFYCRIVSINSRTLRKVRYLKNYPLVLRTQVVRSVCYLFNCPSESFFHTFLSAWFSASGEKIDSECSHRCIIEEEQGNELTGTPRYTV